MRHNFGKDAHYIKLRDDILKQAADFVYLDGWIYFK